MRLTWKRYRHEDEHADLLDVGVFYRGVSDDGREFHVENFGRGEWGVRDVTGEKTWDYWAESKEEAYLAAEVILAGGDLAEHRTHTRYRRNAVPPRGSWISIWSWRCQCGERSSGGLDRQGAHEGARYHRIRAMRAFLDQGEAVL